MKNLMIILVWLIIVCSANSNTWEKVSIKERSQTLNDIKVINHNLIISVGDYGLVKRSKDFGNTWETIRGKYNLEHLKGVCYSGDNIYAVGSNGTLLKSEDDGTNWIRIDINTDKDLNAVSFFGRNGIIIGDSGLVVITNDYGETWNAINIPDIYSNLNDVKFFNEQEVMIIGDNGTCIKSSNGGVDWQIIELMTEGNLLCISENSSEKIFVGGDSFTLIESNNYFETWSIKDSKNMPESFYSILQVNDSLMLSTAFLSGTRHFFSKDGGETWFRSSASNVPISSFDYNRNTAFLCGSVGGIIKIDLEKEIPEHFIMFEEVVEVGEKPYLLSLIAGYKDKSLIASEQRTVYSSNDSGATWEIILDNKGHNVLALAYPADYVQFVISDSSKFVKEDGKSFFRHWPIISKSTDAGLSWKHTRFEEELFVKEVSVSGDYGIAYGYRKYLKTTNGGNDWDIYDAPDGYSFDDLQVLTNGVVYALDKDVNNNYHLIKTYNDFNNYKIETCNLIKSNFKSICFINEDIGWLALGNTFNNLPNKIYKTIDGGINWDEKFSISNLPLDVGLRDILFADKMHGFCIGSKGYVFQTTDGGESWIENSIDSYSSNVSIYYPNPSLVYVGDGTGIFRLINDNTSSVEDHKKLNTHSIYLHPNPATSQITLTLSDEYITEPQIDVIDNLGFIHEPEYQINSNEITINTSTFSPGVYFLRVRSGELVETKKFVVVR